MVEPRPDAFAALLGIEVQRLRPGHTVATLATTDVHANPHGTVHGAVLYCVAGAAVAAAANDEERSGIISSVLIEYLAPADREDIFTGTLRRGGGDLLAWVRARGTRRSRPD